MKPQLGLLLTLVPEVVRGIFSLVRERIAQRKAEADARKAEAEAKKKT